MNQLQTLQVSQVVETIPGSIYFGDDRTVTVCGANCAERELVVEELRQAQVSTETTGCLGGCATYGTLACGSYARVPEHTEDGVVKSLVVIRPPQQHEL